MSGSWPFFLLSMIPGSFAKSGTMCLNASIRVPVMHPMITSIKEIDEVAGIVEAVEKHMDPRLHRINISLQSSVALMTVVISRQIDTCNPNVGNYVCWEKSPC